VHRVDGLRCVVDAKYKTSNGYSDARTDLYQLTAYCTALGLKTGHLVYADGTAEITSRANASHRPESRITAG
jgi:5-methylcytosine-specific restriction enzyme subunit McrC